MLAVRILYNYFIYNFILIYKYIFELSIIKSFYKIIFCRTSFDKIVFLFKCKCHKEIIWIFYYKYFVNNQNYLFIFLITLLYKGVIRSRKIDGKLKGRRREVVKTKKKSNWVMVRSKQIERNRKILSFLNPFSPNMNFTASRHQPSLSSRFHFLINNFQI